MTEKIFTHEEVGVIFGVTRQTVYNWQRAGKLPNEITAVAIERLIAEKRAEVEQAQREVADFQRRFRAVGAVALASA